jgi:Tol biopolymer transport system component
MAKKTHGLIKLSLLVALATTAGCVSQTTTDSHDAIVFRVSELHEPDQICTISLNSSNSNCWVGDNWDSVLTLFWSPNKEHIALTGGQEGGYRELYVVGADGSNQIQLSQIHTLFSFPIPEWSADSQELRSIVYDENFVPTASRVALDGTDPCILFDSTIQDGTISSNCSQISGTQLITLYQNNNLDIYLVDFDQAAVRKLTESDGQTSYGSASLSPDGQHIAFVGVEQNDTDSQAEATVKLYVMDVDGSNFHFLVDTQLDYALFGWSPDSTRIAFSAIEGETYPDIYVVDIRDFEIQQLTEGVEEDYFGSWSPDGEHIVFSRLPTTFSSWELYVMDSNGDNQHSVAVCGRRECIPDW